MGQINSFSIAGLRLRNPVKALHDAVKDRAERKQHLSELKNLNAFFLEDIGLFEYTRSQILRSN